MLCLGKKCGLGTGANGALSGVAGMTTTINQVSTTALGTAAGSAVVLGSATGFQVGQAILLHQTQGVGAGNWELQAITALAGTTATTSGPLKNTYVAGAQAVVVPQYTTVNLPATSVLNAPAWNGSVGGILTFMANGAVTVTGSIDMKGQGFRGPNHTSGCFPGLAPNLRSAACVFTNGFAGESSAGPSVASLQSGNNGAANGAGGGGGSKGQDCSGGGGGSYGTLGGTGATGTVGCRRDRGARRRAARRAGRGGRFDLDVLPGRRWRRRRAG